MFHTDMNYVSAVYAILVLIIVIDWFARGRREYKAQDERHDEAAAPLLRESVSEDGEERVSRAQSVDGATAVMSQ